MNRRLCERCQALIDQGLDAPPELDVGGEFIVVDGKRRMVSPIDMDLLMVLYSRRGRRLSADALVSLVWGATPCTNGALRNHIMSLRRTLDGSRYEIDTKIPYGYSLEVH